MIDGEKQDLAADYVLGSLDARAEGAFEAALQTDAELRASVYELHETNASLAHTATRVPLPPALRERVIAVARSAAKPAPAQVPIAAENPTSGASFGFLPWALAAALAITTAAFWFERNELRSELTAARHEALALRTSDALSRMKIATLAAQSEAFAKASAVVVWDGEKQRGVIRLLNVPRTADGRDYQLWVIDPKYPQPVSAGVVRLGDDGLTRVSFSPLHTIHSADKFAISVEQAGGALQPAGPIVMLGN